MSDILRLVTTFDPENHKFKPDVNRMYIGTVKEHPENIIKRACASAPAGVGLIDPKDETHMKHAVTIKSILESIAKLYTYDDCTIPINTDTEIVELPEAGSVKGYRNVKPNQEVKATNLVLKSMQFQVEKNVIYIVDPEESKLKTEAFRSRYNALTLIEAAKEVVRLKTEAIVKNMLLAKNSITASNAQKWDGPDSDPYDIIWQADDAIEDKDCGECNLVLANKRTWSKFIQHKAVKGYASGANHPDYNSGNIFPVPGAKGVFGKMAKFMPTGQAMAINKDWFEVALQSYMYIEQAYDISRGSGLYRIVNFDNAGIWHQGAGYKLTGLLA